MSDEENNNDRKFSSLVREGVCVGGGGGGELPKLRFGINISIWATAHLPLP